MINKLLSNENLCFYIDFLFVYTSIGADITYYIEFWRVFNNPRYPFFVILNLMNYDGTLVFCDIRSLNAAAESFNAKIKLFRANLHGVVDKKFFLFRIAKLYGYPH